MHKFTHLTTKLYGISFCKKVLLPYIPGLSNELNHLSYPGEIIIKKKYIKNKDK